MEMTTSTELEVRVLELEYGDRIFPKSIIFIINLPLCHHNALGLIPLGWDISHSVVFTT
jgi:hypothetical protein